MQNLLEDINFEHEESHLNLENENQEEKDQQLNKQVDSKEKEEQKFFELKENGDQDMDNQSKMSFQDYLQNEIEENKERQVISNQFHKDFGNNKIQTSKYTFLTFIPKNLSEQFSKIANIWFLVCGLLQTVKAISITDGKPTIFLPLLMIVIITMIKDLFEDNKRRKQDNEENDKQILTFKQGKFSKSKWQDLQVGNIVKIQENEMIPADVLIIRTSHKNGTCLIETKNLDGETNLKQKYAEKKIFEEFKTLKDEQFNKKLIHIQYEPPNRQLYVFRGNAQIEDNGKFVIQQKFSLNDDNFLLRGSSLKYTHEVIGVVLYTGHDTKIMKNSFNARAKKSQLESKMQHLIIQVFLLIIGICFISATIQMSWFELHKQELTYMYIDKDDSNWYKIIINFIINTGKWPLMINNLVPISLLVTLETVKFIQGVIIGRDEQLTYYDYEHPKFEPQPCIVQASNLNEELGQIKYILTDKTGTLTCNKMMYKNISIGGISYGDKLQDLGSGNQNSSNIYFSQGVTSVDFQDQNLFAVLKQCQQNQGQIRQDKIYNEVLDSILSLAICHSIVLDEHGAYSGMSPDEVALVNFARYCGYQFLETDSQDILKIKNLFDNSIITYKLLQSFAFDSDRKRMSVIVQNTQNSQITLFCKGADNIIFQRMRDQSNDNLKKAMSHLDEYSKEGLRTLLIGKKVIQKQEFEIFNQKYESAKALLFKRETETENLQDQLERNIEFVCATAIEDKLQDEVANTLKAFKNAGIKVWVLTGDKPETAINIGYSTNLIISQNKLYNLTDKNPTQNIIIKCFKKIKSEQIQNNNGYSIVLTGDWIFLILENSRLKEEFLKIGLKAYSLIICRVSPGQKQELVTLVRSSEKSGVLAIGDGANDVNMITAATVGIGIKGVEGLQAARVADYAIGEFKILRRLLFVHGREAYRRNSILVCYSFYKNIVLVFPQIFTGFFNFMSGTTPYETILLYQMFNTLYSLVPNIVYSTTERDLQNFDQQLWLNKEQNYYQDGILNAKFNGKVFWSWIYTGLYHALVISILPLFLLENYSDENGKILSFYETGFVIFTLAVIVVNMKIIIVAKSFNIGLVVSIIGSFIAYWLTCILVDKFNFTDIYHIFSKIKGNYKVYLVILLCICLTSLVEYAIELDSTFKTGKEINDIQKQKLQDKIQDEDQKSNQEKTSKNNKKLVFNKNKNHFE